MKKSLDFLNNIDTLGIDLDFSDPKVLKSMVEDNYSHVAKKIKNSNHHSHRFYSLLDFDKPRIKRRIEATLSSYPKVLEIAAPICPAIPGAFSIEEDWAAANATPLPSLDLLEERSYLTVAAAIWILDRAKAAGRINDVAILLHDSLPIATDVFMPDLWDSCHDSNLLQNTIVAIQERNFDCPAARKKRARGERPRPFADRDTTAGKHHQDVPSRQCFESLLSLVPEEDKQAAVRHFESKFWEWVGCYYRCRVVYARQEGKLYKNYTRFSRLARNFIKEQRQEISRRKSAPSVLPNKASAASMLNELTVAAAPGAMNRTPLLRDRLNTKNGLVYDVQTLSSEMIHLDMQFDALDNEISDFIFDSVSNVAAAPEQLETQYGSEIAETLSDFSIDDPYELCFAVLYLLDNGSTLPWLYFPTSNLVSHAAARLPWGQGSFDVENDPFWAPPGEDDDPEDEESEDDEPQYALRTAPKGSRLPKAIDWYRLDYFDKTLAPEERQRTNLAQLVYQLTGGVVPRDTQRYVGVPGELACFGLKERESLLVSSCITLLSEAQHRNMYHDLDVDEDDGFPEETLEEDDEEEENGNPTLTETNETLSQLRERISALKQENSKLRHAIYTAVKEAEEEKEKYAELTEKTQFEHRELAELREIFFYQKNEIEEAPAAGIEYPYTVRKRTVVFGGHDSWARAIKPMLKGDIRFIDRNMLPNADLIRNADNVWLQTNSLSHKFYNRIMDVVRTYEIPLHYFKFASAEKCAEQIALRDAE